MAEPLEAAQNRLQAALLAGEDTTSARAELAKLTEKQDVQDCKTAETEAKQRQQREASIADRAEALAEQAGAGIAALIAKHPIPRKPT